MKKHIYNFTEWYQRPVPDSDYNDHWEYKLIDPRYRQNYMSRGWVSRSEAQQSLKNSLRIDPDKIQVKKTVAKIQLKKV